MIGIAGLSSVVMGAIVAYASDRYPSHTEALEISAGLLVLGGFAVAAYAFSTLMII
jgi:hypothetical protein